MLAEMLKALGEEQYQLLGHRTLPSNSRAGGDGRHEDRLVALVGGGECPREAARSGGRPGRTSTSIEPEPGCGRN